MQVPMSGSNESPIYIMTELNLYTSCSSKLLNGNTKGDLPSEQKRLSFGWSAQVLQPAANHMAHYCSFHVFETLCTRLPGARPDPQLWGSHQLRPCGSHSPRAGGQLWWALSGGAEGIPARDECTAVPVRKPWGHPSLSLCFNLNHLTQNTHRLSVG